MDNITGRLRLTFGFTEMMRGVDFLIAVIGLFGIGEILLSMEEGLSFTGKSAKINPKVVFETWKKLPAYWLIVAAQLPHRLLDGDHARRRDARVVHELRRREAHVEDTATSSATGQIEGVIAPETAAHAAGTSALLPMLALGIPGSPTAAVLLGGLLIWGLQPGPLLFVEQKDFVWGLIASMYLGNLAGLIIVLTCVPLFASILRVPVLDHRAGDHRDLRDRRVYGPRRDARHLVHAGLRRRSATCSRSSTTRSRRWCWRWCWATAPRTRSGSRC